MPSKTEICPRIKSASPSNKLPTDRLIFESFNKMNVVREMIETDKERRGNAEEWHSPSDSVTMSTNAAGGAEHSDKTSE